MSYSRTVIIGAGFGGLEVAKRLAKAKTDVLVIDKMNHHLFQPLLYQVATCALSPGDIANPIRQILSRQPHTSFIMGNVVRIDKSAQRVYLECGMQFDFDNLVVATGTRHSYFGNDAWEPLAPGLKTLNDALLMREKILWSFEEAERAPTHAEAKKFLRFAIVGAGPTGVELAGALAEIAFKNFVKNYRKIRSDQAEIFLIEGASSILPGFPEKLAKQAKSDLEKLGVIVMTNQKVTGVTHEGVMIGSSLMPAHTVLWAAGNSASPLLKTLGTPLDRQGRALIEPDLSLPGHPEIFVIGDAACTFSKNSTPLPALAPVAKQQGKFVAHIIKNSIPKEARGAFSYFDKGALATIGKGKAVGMLGKLTFTGHFAWFIWSVVHIMYLVGFKNRLQVFIHWSYLYITNKRPVQLIVRPIKDALCQKK